MKLIWIGQSQNFLGEKFVGAVFGDRPGIRLLSVTAPEQTCPDPNTLLARVSGTDWDPMHVSVQALVELRDNEHADVRAHSSGLRTLTVSVDGVPPASEWVQAQQVSSIYSRLMAAPTVALDRGSENMLWRIQQADAITGVPTVRDGECGFCSGAEAADVLSEFAEFNDGKWVLPWGADPVIEVQMEPMRVLTRSGVEYKRG